MKKPAVEMDRPGFFPQELDDFEKFVGTLVAFVMGLVVAVPPEVHLGRSSNDVQGDSAVRQVIQGVDLLGEERGARQAWAKCDEKFDLFRHRREGGGGRPGVHAVRSRGDKNVGESRFFGRPGDTGEIFLRGRPLGRFLDDLIGP